MRLSVLAFCISSTFFVGCSSTKSPSTDVFSGDVQTNLDSSWTVHAGDNVHVVVEASPFAIRLYRDNEETMFWGPDSLGFGEVDEVVEDYNHDPYWLHHSMGPLKADPPAGLQWNGITEVVKEIEEGDEELLTLQVELSLGGSALLLVKPSVSGAIELRIKANSDRPTAYIYAHWEARVGENF